MIKAGLALGGGGVRGVAHVVYLEAFEELGMMPSIISGTSIGAVIGALYAGGMRPKQILGLLDDIFSTKKRTVASLLRAKRKSGSLAAFARDYFSKVLPKKTFGELHIPLKIVATNFHSLKEKVFDEGEIIPALMCSIALPSVFAPQCVQGAYYMDGGATNIVPFDIIRDDCDVLVAIDVSRVRPNDYKPGTKNAMRATWAATHQTLIEHKLKYCPVELFERPTFSRASAMEFYKYMQIYAQAQEGKQAFAQKLKLAIERSTHNV